MRANRKGEEEGGPADRAGAFAGRLDADHGFPSLSGRIVGMERSRGPHQAHDDVDNAGRGPARLHKR